MSKGLRGIRGSAFDPKRSIAPEEFRDFVPTVMCLLRNRDGGLLLTRYPYAENGRPYVDYGLNQWMPPQTGIRRGETLSSALRRLLTDKCGYRETDLNGLTDSVLGRVAHETRRGHTRMFYVVAASLSHNHLPTQNRNVEIIVVNGIADLWKKVGDCRPEKKVLIARVVGVLVKSGFMPPETWQPQLTDMFLADSLRR